MEDEIKKILEDYKVYGAKQDLITEKLLVLFSVSQQRELLVAAFEKMNRPQITMLEIGEYEELAKELLSSD